MSALLAQAQQMQQSLMAAQQRLINSEVHGEAGGGLVEVTVKGSGEVVAVKIDPKVVDPDDVETLQDLIVGALGDASNRSPTLAQEQLGPLAGGMGCWRTARAMFEGPVQDLIDELGKLPGIGPKSAQRIAFHLLSVEPPDIDRLTAVLAKVRDGVRFCAVCGNVSDDERAASARTRAATARRSASSRSRRTSRPSSAPANSAGATTFWAARWTRCPASAPTAADSRAAEPDRRASRRRGHHRGDHRHRPQHRGRGDRHLPGPDAARHSRPDRDAGSRPVCRWAATWNSPTS